MHDDTETSTSWLSPDDLETARSLVPMVYVEAIPIRVDGSGQLTHLGLLLRVRPDGSISRATVAGRVLHHERVREALVRNLEKDLGPVALPRLPASPAPFMVAEYFPDPIISGYHDPRHHAVSLVFVVPVDGDCQPTQEALDLSWLTPDEIMAPGFREEMAGGQERLVVAALAHCGALP
ncbi:MAG: DUF4916 domain-containing protein [Actinomycetota bacterium]|nr:DUF4916 domain-containing protein [Actinomycetota bacterium]